MADPIKTIATDKACPVAGPYSQAVLAEPGYRTLYISGQLPATPSGHLLKSCESKNTGPEPVDSTVSQQTAACLVNVLGIIRATEPTASLNNVVKCTVFLTDMKNFAEMNREYEKVFAGYRPARSCVAVKELPKGVPVEIEAIAVLPPQQTSEKIKM